MIFGGREAPCVSKDELAEIARASARPCPRVELDPSIRAEGKVLTVMLSTHGSVFAPDVLRGLVPNRRERARVVMRLLAADGDRRVEAARRVAEQQAAEEKS